jgi:hypothetical protein
MDGNVHCSLIRAAEEALQPGTMLRGHVGGSDRTTF